jgi:hypothetical protein
MRADCVRALPAAAAVFIGLVAMVARADDCRGKAGLSTCIDSDNLWPHAGGGSFFAIGSSATTPVGSLSAGLVGSYLVRPMELTVASPDPAGSTIGVINNAIDATLLFAYGVTDRLELTLALPAALYRDGAGISGVLGTGPSLGATILEPRFGLTLGVLRRTPVRAAATAEAEAGAPSEKGAGLVVRLEAALPFAPTTSFARAPTMVGAPSVTFDYRLGRLDLAAEIGGRIRGEATFGTAVVGSQVMGALGASFDVVRRRWLTASAETFFLYGASGQLPSQVNPANGTPPALVPAEWIASLSNAAVLGGDVILSVGAGGAIPTTTNGALTAPAFRLDFGIRYASPAHNSPRARSAPGTGLPPTSLPPTDNALFASPREEASPERDDSR